jgi:hypothetical protein
VPEPLTVAAVHATPASIGPLRSALAAELPGSEMWNIIDDHLAADADTAGELTPALRDRMLNLVRHGVDGGADAVLIACSMYGEVAKIAERLFPTPVFASDTDMFADAIDVAPRRVAVLASLQGSAADTTARLAAALEGAGQSADVVPVFCRGAAHAASTGDASALVAALATGLGTVDGPLDLVCMAQYSLSPAADALGEKVAVPIMAPTRAAARAVARRLGQA